VLRPNRISAIAVFKFKDRTPGKSLSPSPTLEFSGDGLPIPKADDDVATTCHLSQYRELHKSYIHTYIHTYIHCLYITSALGGETRSFPPLLYYTDPQRIIDNSI